MAEELSLGDRKIVSALLEQRKEEASFMAWVQKREEKSIEKRMIIIARNRFFSLRPGGKIAREAHWLELVEIRAPTDKEMTLTFKQFKIDVISPATDEIIHCIRNAYANAFPGVPEKDRYRLDVPGNRLRELDIKDQVLGGFIVTYRSLCDFYQGTEVREDIIWDMENLFVPGNIKDFNLKELEQPISFNDIRALLAALQYNGYFRSLKAKDFPLSSNMVQAIAEALKFNQSLDEIVLSRTGITKDGSHLIGEALTFNKILALTSLDLSNNPLEDKGLTALANYIGGLNRGIVKIDLSNCQGTKAGMAVLCNALKRNVHMANTLTYFDISQNKVESDGSSALSAFLANPNSIRVLRLGSTMANLDVIIGAIIRGCNELQILDISGNKLQKKETSTLAKYLQATASLTTLNLSNTAIPVDSIKELLTAMGANLYLKNCVLNLSQNKLGVPGARVIASLADKMTNVTSLDLGDNDFGDEGISILCEGLCYNRNLKHIALDQNFKASKAKAARSQAIESIVNLISSECPVESLSLQGGKGSELKVDIVEFLYALGTNDTLLSLDITGNQMGNKGAAALGKALQTNTKLESLKWDNNGTTYQGFYAFNVGLKRNHTLKNAPMPIADISTALKSSEREMSEIVEKMERNMLRNQNPAQFQTSSTGDLARASNNQFAFLTSGQREEVQKLLYRIKSTGRKVADHSRIVIEDAENQDNTMTALYSIKDTVHQSFELELRSMFTKFVKDCSPVFAKYKGSMIEQLMDSTRKSYKCLDDQTIKRMQTNLAYGGRDLPEDEFERILIAAAFAQLSSKASQAFFSTVSIASDYLYEKVQDQLSDIADEMQSEVTSELMGSSSRTSTTSGNNPNNNNAGGSKPPNKPPPKLPVKSGKPAPPAKPPKGKKPGAKDDNAHVEALPKAQSNLEHATKERPQVQQKRKPPTRKRRPAPPAASQM